MFVVPIRNIVSQRNLFLLQGGAQYQLMRHQIPRLGEMAGLEGVLRCDDCGLLATTDKALNKRPRIARQSLSAQRNFNISHVPLGQCHRCPPAVSGHDFEDTTSCASGNELRSAATRNSTGLQRQPPLVQLDNCSRASKPPTWISFEYFEYENSTEKWAVCIWSSTHRWLFPSDSQKH
jgi:hypothetical protein